MCFINYEKSLVFIYNLITYLTESSAIIFIKRPLYINEKKIILLINRHISNFIEIVYTAFLSVKKIFSEYQIIEFFNDNILIERDELLRIMYYSMFWCKINYLIFDNRMFVTNFN